MPKYSFMTKIFSLRDAKEPDIKREVSISLNESVTTKIMEWYEITCTAEYIMDNFAELLKRTEFEESTMKELEKNLTEDIAVNIATEVRRRMRKFYETEDDALCNIFNEDFDMEYYKF